ncbi:MAG: sodium:proton exchanger, partial [Chitinivibrionales bacterium]|nr:sodium:proton exchanger [Chitinivibrionales bacterium]
MRRFCPLLVLIPALALASTGENDGETMIHLMTRFVMQLGVIVFAARIGGDLARKLRLPSVIGELGAGILLGPSLLGAVGLPGFAQGLFPHPAGSVLPVSPELYAIATVASIILLFNAGLETDLSMLWRFSGAGLTVGIGGVVISFTLGALATSIATGTELFSPLCLFMGAISTATSVGVTARLLQESKRLDSPEGVTILTGAVIDDVIGIIVLAVVLGLHTAVTEATDGQVGWGQIGLIAFRAVSVWIGFTALGLIFSDRIAAFLKRFGSITTFSILALGLSLLVGGLFEKAGLAMIIGAYVT